MNQFSFTFDFVVVALDEAIVFLVRQRPVLGLHLLLVEHDFGRLFDAIVKVNAFLVLLKIRLNVFSCTRLRNRILTMTGCTAIRRYPRTSPRSFTMATL